MFTLTIEDKHGGIADEYSFEEGEFLVGRSHSADIILPSDNVSRRHARLYTVHGRCYIEDLGSANGVFVNGRRIHEVYEIESSAQVRVGDYYLHIKSDAAPQAEDRIYCRMHGRNLSVTDQVFRVTRTVNLVGRGKDCTITVIDPSVSRIHSKLTVERSGALTIEDLKSSNGTFVNGERIEVATLNHRDLVRFGNVEFMCEFPDLAPSDGADPTGMPIGSATDLDEPWEGGSRRGLWIGLSIVIGLLVTGAVLLLIFKDDLGAGAEIEPDKELVEAQKAADDAKKDDEEKKAEVAELVKEGKAHIKNRQWDLALEKWKRVKERDPFNDEAQKAINQVAIWKKHQKAIDEARALAKPEKKEYGKAAKLLRDIDEGSIYYLEAQEELKRLLDVKTSLVMQADALLKSKDCKGAADLYGQAKQLDPRDKAIGDKLAHIKTLSKRACKTR